MKKTLLALVAFVLLAFTALAQSAPPTTGTGLVGHSCTFSVTASGTTPFTYQWYKGAPPGSAISGATGQTYQIAALALADATTYYVVVSNSAGSTTSNNAVLTVNQVVTITNQPQSVSVAYGAPATFTIVASGAPAPTYQWQLNGVNVAGATSPSYTIASATASGMVTCVVSNAVGSVTSTSANLTVASAPVAPTLQPVTIQFN
jgi:hypothetical protein